MIDWGFAPSPWALVIAFAIDWLWGELPSTVHPVVWIGRGTHLLTRYMPHRPAMVAVGLGLLTVVLVCGASVLFAALAVSWLPEHPARHLVEGVLLSTTFAVRALGEAVLAVARALDAKDTPRARDALRSLCSRDPSSLGDGQLCAAAIESGAENASDSFVAPLFYYALFGLPGAFAYRAVNTLDAMLGYRGKFEYLGKPAARLDDLVNLVPARMTALLLLLCSFRPSGFAQAVRVWYADARQTESPNAGHPMAMMAGLLGVRLEKVDAYALGASFPEPTPVAVKRCWIIVARSAWLAVALAALACFWHCEKNT